MRGVEARKGVKACDQKRQERLRTRRHKSERLVPDDEEVEGGFPHDVLDSLQEGQK
jgi:hypothetical protein